MYKTFNQTIPMQIYGIQITVIKYKEDSENVIGRRHITLNKIAFE